MCDSRRKSGLGFSEAGFLFEMNRPCQVHVMVIDLQRRLDRRFDVGRVLGNYLLELLTDVELWCWNILGVSGL